MSRAISLLSLHTFTERKEKTFKFYPFQLHALRPKRLPHGPLLTLSHISVFTKFTSLP